MKVKELIAVLQKLPADADVLYAYDGASRGDIEFCWLARGDQVVIAGLNSVIYDDHDRPLDAPLTSINRYWSTPEELP